MDELEQYLAELVKDVTIARFKKSLFAGITSDQLENGFTTKRHLKSSRKIAIWIRTQV